MAWGDALENPYSAPETMGRPVVARPDDAPRGEGGVLTVTYRSDTEDIALLLHQLLASSPASRVFRALIMALLLGMYAALVAQMQARMTKWVAFALGGWFVVRYLIWVRRPNGRRMMAMARTYFPQPMQTVEIGPEGISARREDGAEDRRPWRTIRKLESLDGNLLIYLDDLGKSLPLAQLVPRRAFATPEAAEAFRRAATEWHEAASGGAAVSGVHLSLRGEPGPTVTFELTEEERSLGRRANRAMFLHMRRVAIVSMIAALAAIVWGVEMGRWMGRVPGATWMLLAGPVGMVGFGIVMLISWSRLARLLIVGPGSNRGASGPRTISLTPRGLRARFASGREALLPWSSFGSIQEDDRFLRFATVPFLQKQRVGEILQIPRRAFADTGSAATFVRTARDWHAEATGEPAGRYGVILGAW